MACEPQWLLFISYEYQSPQLVECTFHEAWRWPNLRVRKSVLKLVKNNYFDNLKNLILVYKLSLWMYVCMANYPISWTHWSMPSSGRGECPLKMAIINVLFGDDSERSFGWISVVRAPCYGLFCSSTSFSIDFRTCTVGSPSGFMKCPVIINFYVSYPLSAYLNTSYGLME